MRKKMSLVAVGLLAGATMSMTASPAHAQPDPNCAATDPVLAYVCRIINSAPEPGPTINHYYYQVTGAVHTAYCQVSPYC
ncbi:MAG TPA: hypothetical protein VEV43_10330 [Actinomycetota bacterium]|nr:hypothetical protein [Actinomycetota bacterium]